MAKKTVFIFSLFLVVYSVSTCKLEWFSALSEPVTENYYQIFLPKTGQTTCYDASGTEIPCAGTGQDGEYQRGAAWPSPRFIDNGNGTITDRLTGLMWVKDGSASGIKNWQGALDYVKTLTAGGYTDWRLPNINELASLMNYGQGNTAGWLNSQGFYNVQSNQYWSSSNYIRPWSLYVNSDSLTGDNVTSTYYVLAVRGNGNAGAVRIPKTGVSISVSIADDGQFQTGVSWPTPRFINNGNDTITDRLTGLMWIKDGSASSNWQDAQDYVKTLNTGGYTDWRLPNINELASLSHYGQQIQAVWLNSQGFTGMQQSLYWSSSTYAGNNAYAYTVQTSSTSNCALYYTAKNSNSHVLAVRGGQ